MTNLKLKNRSLTPNLFAKLKYYFIILDKNILLIYFNFKIFIKIKN